MEMAKSSIEDVVDPLQDISEDMGKYVLLLGQAFQRRFNSLSAVVTDHGKLRETSREKGDILRLKDEQKKPFGGKCQNLHNRHCED